MDDPRDALSGAFGHLRNDLGRNLGLLAEEFTVGWLHSTDTDSQRCGEAGHLFELVLRHRPVQHR